MKKTLEYLNPSKKRCLFNGIALILFGGYMYFFTERTSFNYLFLIAAGLVWLGVYAYKTYVLTSIKNEF